MIAVIIFFSLKIFLASIIKLHSFKTSKSNLNNKIPLNKQNIDLSGISICQFVILCIFISTFLAIKSRYHKVDDIINNFPENVMLFFQIHAIPPLASNSFVIYHIYKHKAMRRFVKNDILCPMFIHKSNVVHVN